MADAIDDDLAELQRLCDAATPGPWTLDEDGDLRAGGRAPHGLYAVATLLAPATTEDSAESNDATARFIAVARDALPKLIARVRVLEHRLAGVDALVAEFPNDPATALGRILQHLDTAEYCDRDPIAPRDHA